MTKEDRILNNQLAIMSSLKEILRYINNESTSKNRTNDRRWLANCCNDTIYTLKGDVDKIPDHLEYL